MLLLSFRILPGSLQYSDTEKNGIFLVFLYFKLGILNFRKKFEQLCSHDRKKNRQNE